jgi:hypothetical protein
VKLNTYDTFCEARGCQAFHKQRAESFTEAIKTLRALGWVSTERDRNGGYVSFCPTHKPLTPPCSGCSFVTKLRDCGQCDSCCDCVAPTLTDAEFEAIRNALSAALSFIGLYRDRVIKGELSGKLLENDYSQQERLKTAIALMDEARR